MPIADLFKNKSIKTKDKVQAISEWLITGSLTIYDLVEFASSRNLEMINLEILEFVTNTLTDNAPRIKWESAKVIGNIAHLFPKKLDLAIDNLSKIQRVMAL